MSKGAPKDWVDATKIRKDDITPDMLRRAVFSDAKSRFGFGTLGYDMTEVDEFMDLMAEHEVDLRRRISDLEETVRSLSIAAHRGGPLVQHWPDETESDLPAGYRWATMAETEAHQRTPGSVPGMIVVQRTQDSAGRPYFDDEADLAVPIVLKEAGRFVAGPKEGYGATEVPPLKESGWAEKEVVRE